MSRLIDADAAIWELTTGCFPQSMEYTRAVGIAKRLIQEMPTIEAVPVRHGSIIETIEDGRMKRVFSCCGTDFTKMTCWMMPNYCPNCGAKLHGGADDVSD